MDQLGKKLEQKLQQIDSLLVKEPEEKPSDQKKSGVLAKAGLQQTKKPPLKTASIEEQKK
jgi:hypothetical protein